LGASLFSASPAFAAGLLNAPTAVAAALNPNAGFGVSTSVLASTVFGASAGVLDVAAAAGLANSALEAWKEEAALGLLSIGEALRNVNYKESKIVSKTIISNHRGRSARARDGRSYQLGSSEGMLRYVTRRYV
jgi:hypothetical protein